MISISNLLWATLTCFLIALVQCTYIPQRQRHIGQQSYHVTGTFLCGEHPAVGVKVKLIDDDFGSDPDDELDVGFTDENGNFDLSGGTAEMTTIDPHLKVYHDCNDGKTPCQRRWKFELPNHYIQLPTHRHHHHQQQQQQPPQYSSHEVHLKRKTLNIGVWNLEAILPAESHDCIH